MAVVLAVAAVAAIAFGSGGRPAAAARPKATSRYGQLPSWLPNISSGTSKLEVARPSSPVLHEAQGYTVHARLPEGSGDITAVGPQVPPTVASAAQTGSWPEGRPVPGRFTVTLVVTKGVVPVSAHAFTILTDAGRIVHPLVTVDGGGRLPATLRAGQHINLAVEGGVAAGSGSIRWAPLGPRVLVGWIYQLELD